MKIVRRFTLLIVVVALVVCVVACSEALKVTVVNRSGSEVQACSIDTSSRQCIELAASATGTFAWTTGKLEIRRATCIDSYVLAYEGIDPWRDYLHKDESAIVLVLREDRKLLIVRNELSPDRVTEQNQPKGFPISPTESASHCV